MADPSLTNTEKIRLFQELGEIAGKLDAIKIAIDAHERLDIERFSNIEKTQGRHERRLDDLEEADITGQHDNLEEIKRKAAKLEERASADAAKAADEKKKADDEAAKTRAATIRNAIFLCVGGLITLGFTALAHALGLK